MGHRGPRRAPRWAIEVVSTRLDLCTIKRAALEGPHRKRRQPPHRHQRTPTASPLRDAYSHAPATAGGSAPLIGPPAHAARRHSQDR